MSANQSAAHVKLKLDEIARLLNYISSYTGQDFISVRHRAKDFEQRGELVISSSDITTGPTQKAGDQVFLLMEEICQSRNSKGLVVNFQRSASTIILDPTEIAAMHEEYLSFMNDDFSWLRNRCESLDDFLNMCLRPVVSENNELAYTTVGDGSEERFAQLPSSPEIQTLLNHEPRI